jgi:hypothetical protein
MSSSKSVLVVAPGCPAGLVQELLEARLLPAQAHVDVLLPPEKFEQYQYVSDEKTFSVQARFFPSPDRRFFSTSHLKWLQSRLQASENVKVLIFKSPFKDIITALVSLLVMLFSGRTITLFFATPEAVIDLNGQGFSEKWISQELNPQILAQELHRVILFLTPWDLVYFLMFGGLIAKQMLAKYFFSLLRKK